MTSTTLGLLRRDFEPHQKTGIAHRRDQPGCCLARLLPHRPFDVPLKVRRKLLESRDGSLTPKRTGLAPAGFAGNADRHVRHAVTLPSLANESANRCRPSVTFGVGGRPVRLGTLVKTDSTRDLIVAEERGRRHCAQRAVWITRQGDNAIGHRRRRSWRGWPDRRCHALYTTATGPIRRACRGRDAPWRRSGSPAPLRNLLAPRAEGAIKAQKRERPPGSAI